MIPSATETTVILEQVTDFAGQTLPQALDYVQNLSATYGPKAYELVLWKVRVDCISQVAIIACALLACVALAILCRNGRRWEKEARGDDGVPYMFVQIFSAIGFMLTCALCFAWITQVGIWPIVGIFNPELKLASNIIDKVMR